MGLFGQNSPFDADIEKATSDKNTSEPWNLIMDICDKITSNPKNIKDYIRSIIKRIGHQDPHVALQAITLLDACVKNCGKQFHLEVASREFETEYKKLLLKAPPAVATKMRQTIKKWKDNEFKNDPQLALIPSFYQKLKSEGHDFSEQKPPKQSAAQAAALKDPNIVTSQQEEEDIAKAIELSLKEVKSSPKKQTSTSLSSNTPTYPSLYPSFSGPSGGNTNSGSSNIGSVASANVEPRKVRALYDFEAAEENELTFIKGEIIHVLDDTDPNWWKGYNQRGQGLFPSNFVTADLSVEPEQLDINQQQKSKKVQFEDEINNSANAGKKDEKTDILATDLENLSIQTEINEEKVDRLLHLLHEANPEDPSKDTDEMLRLEEEVNQMGPLIDAELELVDRKHAQLTQLSSDLVDAINLYHTLMREPPISSPAHMNYFTNPMAANVFNQPQPNMYSASQRISGQYGMQPMFHIPSNQAMPLPLMQQMPPSNITPNSIPTMISGVQQQIHHNIPGAFYDNSGINNQQLQQIQQNQHQINAVSYQNDQRPNNIQNTQQQLQSLQQIQQTGPTPQTIANNQFGQQAYIQQTAQQISGTIPGITHQQVIAGPPAQHNNLLQQTQPQNQQITGLSTNSITQPVQIGPMQIGNSPSLQGTPQNVIQHPNGICSIPVGTLNHINSNMNNSVIPNSQMQHTIQASSINSTLPHLTNATQFVIGMNQPLNQNMLVQNDTKTNIPIYQQR